MQITSFGVLAVAVFVTQFILCVKKPRLIFRLIPTLLLLAGLAACAIIHAVNPMAGGATFGAAVIGVLIGILLVIDGAAWGVTLLVPNKK